MIHSDTVPQNYIVWRPLSPDVLIYFYSEFWNSNWVAQYVHYHPNNSKWKM